MIRSKYSIHVRYHNPSESFLLFEVFLSLVDSFLFFRSGSFSSNMSSVILNFSATPGVQFPMSAVPTHSIVPQHLAHQPPQPTAIPNAFLQPSQSSPLQASSDDLADILNSPTSSISTGASSPVPTAFQSTANAFGKSSSSSISQSVSVSAVSSSTETFSNTPTTQSSNSLDPASATPTSVLTASTTATPDPSQTLSSSGPLTRQPLFLIGILLGSMAVIACLATLLAWLIRTRKHIRRRHQELAADIPWVRPSSDHTGLEEGRLGDVGRIVGRPLWEALSDHDVGEPKRSESYFNDRGQIYAPYPDSGTPDYQRGGGGPGSVTYPLPVHHGSYQSTLSYGEASPNGHEGAPTLGPLQIFNLMPGDFSADPSPAPSTRSSVNLSGDLGTPRGDDHISRPRFLGLESKGLRVPWNSRPQEPLLSDRRNLLDSEKPDATTTPTTTTAANTGVGETNGWTASIKTNLVNAFNAVAMNLSSSSLNNQKGEETFTPHPSRQAATHRSIRIRSGQFPVLPSSFSDSQSDSGAPVWSLQDRGDGSGAVHFPGIDGHEGEGDGDTHFGATSFGDSPPSPWDAPFMATMKPKEVFLKSRPLRHLSGSGGSTSTTRTGIGTGSGGSRRSNSVYSILSATSSVYPGAGGRGTRPFLPRLSRQSTMTAESLGSNGESESSRARPFRMPSSSGFSLSSYYLDGEDMSARSLLASDEGTGKAGKDRKSQIRNVA